MCAIQAGELCKLILSYAFSLAEFLDVPADPEIWAYAATKGLLSRGKQSVAEACAKHLKEIVGK
jgi:hypothetical protein